MFRRNAIKMGRGVSDLSLSELVPSSRKPLCILEKPAVLMTNNQDFYLTRTRRTGRSARLHLPHVFSASQQRSWGLGKVRGQACSWTFWKTFVQLGYIADASLERLEYCTAL
jgi:hypothetical protein